MNCSACNSDECATPCGFCHCGCGRTAPVWGTDQHVLKRLRGTPKTYVRGHNQRGRSRPDHAAFMKQWADDHPDHMNKLIESGNNATRNRPRKAEHTEKWKAARIANGNWAMRGEGHPMWKGGTQIDNGYAYVWQPEHQRATKAGYVRRSRLLVEEHLRSTDPASPYLQAINGALCLHPGVDVHHINEVTTDDRVENLQPMWRSEHARMHGMKRNHFLKRRLR